MGLFAGRGHFKTGNHSGCVVISFLMARIQFHREGGGKMVKLKVKKNVKFGEERFMNS